MPPQDLALAPRIPISGWIEAGLFVFAIGVLSISYAVGQQIGAHPVALVLYAMLISALTLLAVTGPGPEALRIMRAPQSWLVGIGIIGMEIFYYQLMAHAAPAHGSLLVRVAVPISMAVGWGLFARRPPGLALIGAAVVMAGITPLVFTIAPEHRLAAVGAALGSALAFVMRTFATEFHPWNRRAKTVMEKLRISGLVVLVTSLASLVLAGSVALLVSTGALQPTTMIPTVAQMLHWPTILLGLFVGTTVLTAMATLSFSAVVKITSENFTAATCFTPIATFIVQIAAGAAGLIPIYPPDSTLLPAMAVVVIGVLMIIYAARRR